MISTIVVSIEGWQVMVLLCLSSGVVIDGDSVRIAWLFSGEARLWFWLVLKFRIGSVTKSLNIVTVAAYDSAEGVAEDSHWSDSDMHSWYIWGGGIKM